MISTSDSKTELFDLKQKFLRQIPHPKLIRSAIQKAMRKSEIELEVPDLKAIHLTIDQKAAELIPFLEKAITRELAFKQQVAHARSFEDLSQSLLWLFKHQVKLCLKLQHFLPANHAELKDTDIKMSDPFDLYAILKSIDTNQKDSEIQQQLLTELNQGTFEWSQLATACLRANKIIKHG